jgi:hypothetical protein
MSKVLCILGLIFALAFPALAQTQTQLASSSFPGTSLGSSWTTASGGFAVSGNVVTGEAGESDAWYNATSFPSNQYSTVEFVPETGDSGSYVGACVRRNGSGPGNTGNGYEFIVSPGGAWLLRKTTSGSNITLTSGSTSALSSGETVTLYAYNTTLTAYVGGVLISTVTDSTYSSGAPGISEYNAGASIGLGTWSAGSLSENVAASCNASDVQDAINAASSGQTVIIPAGSCAWTTSTVTPAVSITSTFPITLAGQTVVTGAGTSSPSANDGATTGYPPSCPSNTAGTCIFLDSTDRVTFNIATPTTGFITLQGITFLYSGANATGISNGALTLGGAAWPPLGPSFQMKNCHVLINTNNNGSTPLFGNFSTAYGLITQNWFQIIDTAADVGTLAFHGDASHGFLSWQTPPSLGAGKAIYAETNTFTYGATNTEGPFDAYEGARVVFRHNYVQNAHDPGAHGTDSGFLRSVFSVESYLNTFVDNSKGEVAMNSRGGQTVAWGNSYGGTKGYGALNLTYNRAPGEAPGLGANWGMADGTPWIAGNVNVSNPNDGGNCYPSLGLNPNLYTCNSTYASPWASKNSYPNLALIIPTSGNVNGYNFSAQGSCVSGSTQPTSWTQTVGATQSPLDGNCTWRNEGGTIAASAPAHWCAISLDFLATTNSQCPLFATNPADTATAFFDGPYSTNGYPGKDEPGRTQNQVLAPDYQWLNTGTFSPFGPNSSATAALVKPNRDYYNAADPSCGSTNQTGGVCTGTHSQRLTVTSCTAGPGGNTPGVAFWETDTNSLYVCNPTNTWTLYYQPYPYPYPL